MEKNKFCDELKKNGYDAIVDGGVVIIRKPGKVEDIIKEIKALAEKYGYNESLGVRTIKSVTANTKSDTTQENSDVKPEEFIKEVDTSNFEQMNLLDMF